MANTNQAKKRIRQNEQARIRNKNKKSAMRTIMKKTLAAVEENDAAAARSLLPEAMQRIDKAAKTNTIHKNTAARYKSRLARRIAAIEKA